MGRPAGSKNRPKDGAKAPKPKGASAKSPPVTGHAAESAKSQITDEQLQGLTSHHVGAYEKALAAKKDADAKFKGVCKIAKAEGIKLSDIKTWIALGTQEGQNAVKAEIEATVRIARWRAADLGTQFKLFDDGDTNSFHAGKAAGLAGDVAKAPAGRDPDEFLRGWHEGQRIKLSGIKQSEQVARDAEFEEGAPQGSLEVEAPMGGDDSEGDDTEPAPVGEDDEL